MAKYTTHILTHCRSRLAFKRGHRCLPCLSRVLSCTQHVHSELHSAAAPSLDALSLREALASVACNGSITTDIGGHCHSRSRLAGKRSPLPSRVSVNAWRVTLILVGQLMSCSSWSGRRTITWEAPRENHKATSCLPLRST